MTHESTIRRPNDSIAKTAKTADGTTQPISATPSNFRHIGPIFKSWGIATSPLDKACKSDGSVPTLHGDLAVERSVRLTHVFSHSLKNRPKGRFCC